MTSVKGEPVEMDAIPMEPKVKVSYHSPLGLIDNGVGNTRLSTTFSIPMPRHREIEFGIQ